MLIWSDSLLMPTRSSESLLPSVERASETFTLLFYHNCNRTIKMSRSGSHWQLYLTLLLGSMLTMLLPGQLQLVRTCNMEVVSVTVIEAC